MEPPRINKAIADAIRDMRRRRHLTVEALADSIVYVSRLGQSYDWRVIVRVIEDGELNPYPFLLAPIVQRLHQVRPIALWEHRRWKRDVLLIPSQLASTRSP